jgi:hypothetical protein
MDSSTPQDHGLEISNDPQQESSKQHGKTTQEEIGSILYEVTPDSMTTNEVSSLMTPLGGFSVQQSLEAKTIQGSSQHDLK